jgi:hypothetical protein
MLPLTATAHPKVRAWRFYPPGRWSKDFHQPSYGIILFLLDNFNPSLISSDGIRDEDDFAVDPGYSISLKGHGTDFDLNLFSHRSKIP